MLVEKSVYLFQEYGRLRFKLVDLLRERGMTRGHLADLVHTKYAVINRMYQGKTERMDCDLLARICYVLDCKLSDIVEYEESRNENS